MKIKAKLLLSLACISFAASAYAEDYVCDAGKLNTVVTCSVVTVTPLFTTQSLTTGPSITYKSDGSSTLGGCDEPSANGGSQKYVCENSIGTLYSWGEVN